MAGRDATSRPLTLAARVHEAATELSASGQTADASRRDAEILARHVLGWDAAQWLARQPEAAPAHFDRLFSAAIARRRRHEPVAYITGVREFYGRPFTVTRDVLIPRPETEFVVDEALVAISSRRTLGPGHDRRAIADVGTGSGCLAVTLALEAPDVDVVATDVSEAALAVAAENAARLSARDRVLFRQVSLVGGDANRYDLIVSNPPYVAEREREAISPEVRDYEPAVALFSGHDGLDLMRALLPAAEGGLVDGGWLIVEIGSDQADAVRALLETSTRLAFVRFVRDLAGHERYSSPGRPSRSYNRAMSCLFCRIVAGDIPAAKVYEDDQLIAFNDIHPQAPMHVLVVPREHIATLNDLTPAHDALVGSMTRRAAALAGERGYAEQGFRTVVNCNAEAGQTVFHLHLHVLGGRTFGWPPG